MTQTKCPRCGKRSPGAYCCGVDFTATRAPWTMTPERVRLVHVIARSRKGLCDEDYRARLRAVGVATSRDLSRAQFHAFLDGLTRLPDSPTWSKRNAERMGRRSAGSNAADRRHATRHRDDVPAVQVGSVRSGDAAGSSGLVGVSPAGSSAE